MTPASLRTRLSIAFMAVLGVAHACYAIWGDKPWAKEIARRLAAGKTLTFNHFLTIGLWYAAVGGAVMCLLAAVVLWLARKTGPTDPTEASHSSATGFTGAGHNRIGRGFWWALTAIFALALVTRVPRLNHSLWNDELMAMEMFVIGEPLTKDVNHDYSNTWTRAIYGNPDSNNHVVCTIGCRLAHQLWESVIGPTDGRTFDEAWLRFPSLLWGLAGIALAALLGVRLAGPRLGLLLAFLMTIHPWCIRFSSETRGYASALAGVLLVIICLHSLLKGGPQRWTIWAGLTLGLALSMLSHAVCAPVIAPMMALVAVVLLLRRDWHTLAWLFAANALAATIFLDLFGPSLPQISLFLKGKAAARLSPMTPIWWYDVASAFTCGEDWHLGYKGMARLPVWQRLGLLAGCYGLVLTGVWVLWRKGGPALKLFLAGWLLAVAAVLAMNVFSKHAMLTWYLCPLLPGMMLCIAFALLQHPRAGAILLAAWLACMAPLTWRQITEDRQPVREAAHTITRDWPKAVSAYFGISDTFVGTYLPSTQVLDRSPGHEDQVGQLSKLEEQAAREHRPFVVWYGGNQTVRSPEIMKYLDNHGFAQAASLRGSDELHDVTIRVKQPPSS